MVAELSIWGLLAIGMGFLFIAVGIWAFATGELGAGIAMVVLGIVVLSAVMTSVNEGP